VIQKFTKPAALEQNAHVESYHSIMKSVICQKYNFETLQETLLIFNLSIKYYNFKRIHSGIQYLSPVDYLKRKGIDMEWNHELKITLHARSESINSFA